MSFLANMVNELIKAPNKSRGVTHAQTQKEKKLKPVQHMPIPNPCP